MNRINKVLPILLVMVMILSSIPMTAQAATEYSTMNAGVSFKVNGKAVIATTYMIMLDGSIVVKVRDIANALKKTDKKFSVTVDTKKKTLTLKPGKSYTAVGGENKNITKDYLGTKSITLYKNSTKQNAKVYTINKEYYVSMTTLAKMADFSMKYNDSTYICTISTKYGYGKEPAAPSTTVVTDTANTVNDRTGLLKEPFPDAALFKNPKSVSDFDRIIKYMVVNSVMSYTVETDVPYDNVFDDGSAYANAEKAVDIDRYAEIYYGAVGDARVTVTGTEKGSALTIKFKGYCDEDKATLEKKNKEYFSKTQATVKSLITSEKITSSMTELEKAKVIYSWISENVDYESGLGDDVEHTGYSAIINKKAVCSGYTALYNLMCRYAGLYDVFYMTGTDKITGGSHMWTVQILDGTRVFTDATWNSSYNYQNFANSSKAFEEKHAWDKEAYPDWKNAPGLAKRVKELVDSGTDIDDEFYAKEDSEW